MPKHLTQPALPHAPLCHCCLPAEVCGGPADFHWCQRLLLLLAPHLQQSQQRVPGWGQQQQHHCLALQTPELLPVHRCWHGIFQQCQQLRIWAPLLPLLALRQLVAEGVALRQQVCCPLGHCPASCLRGTAAQSWE